MEANKKDPMDLRTQQKREYLKAWKARNRDKVREYNKRWYLKNPGYGKLRWARDKERRKCSGADPEGGDGV